MKVNANENPSRSNISCAINLINQALVSWVIKYVFDTKMYALKLKPHINADTIILKGISDSEYAGDQETRIGVYGYIIYYCKALISWKSKSRRSVTLSSAEAEYYACYEAAKEQVFVQNLIMNYHYQYSYMLIAQVQSIWQIVIALVNKQSI
jgi:hypothetical protein